MNDVVVIGFQREYLGVNLELMKNNEQMYDMAILAVYTAELKRWFIVKKQFKTTKKGTKFTYKACKNEKEAKEYSLKIHELLRLYKEKYSLSISENGIKNSQ